MKSGFYMHCREKMLASFSTADNYFSLWIVVRLFYKGKIWPLYSEKEATGRVRQVVVLYSLWGLYNGRLIQVVIL